MSQVMLIAADKPLPLCDYQENRTHQISMGGQPLSITLTEGFKVGEHYYYRDAVEALGFPMRPFRYELSLEYVERDLWRLQDFLEYHLVPEERAELWSVQVGGETGQLRWRQLRLKELNMDALGLLFSGGPICLTVER